MGFTLILAFQKAIGIDSNAFLYHSNLGNIYQRLNEYEKAIKSYQQSIELEPSFAYPYISLVNIFREVGEEDDALICLANAQQLINNQHEYIKACLEAHKGNIDIALDYLENSLLQDPSMRGWAKRDPNLTPLHNSSRFESLFRD